MAQVNPYLNFNGNTEEAFNFYKSVFGGDFVAVMRFKDVPSDVPMPPESKEKNADKIMHISLPIGKGTILMGSDTPEHFQAVMGNNVHISVGADSKDEADKIFKGLSAGGKITMPIDNTFWGAYFGMFTDKFGLNWMVSYMAPQK